MTFRLKMTAETAHDVLVLFHPEFTVIHRALNVGNVTAGIQVKASLSQ